jgi:short-subunit dehydrogenase
MPARGDRQLCVFLTGASSGIGRALAEEYARRGAVLGLVARRGEQLSSLAASLPIRSYCYTADVRDAAAMAKAARDFVERAGVPDVVIANAGVSAGHDSAEPGDNAVFEETLAINVTGMLYTFQPFLPAMKQRGDGKLAGIASIAGFRGLPGASAYSASKAAAIAYLESLRVELRSSGIRVITICPGYIATPMTARNPYPMPFLMPVQTAARQMVAAIDRGKPWHVLPWQMAIMGWLLRRMPRTLYDRFFADVPRKPRRA